MKTASSFPSHFAASPARRRLLGLAVAGAAVALAPSTVLANAWRQTPAIADAVGDAQVETQGLELSLPLVAEDGSSVPLSIKAVEGGRITRLSLFATGNPTPEVAVFEFGPEVPTLSLSTRIRLSESQTVVAVAHAEDGRVLLAQRDVRVTTSGCIAPAQSDPSNEMNARVRVPKAWKVGSTNEVTTMISHPMITGLAEDAQGNTPEQRIIESLEITLDDRLVLRSSFFRSLAANPYLRFDAAPHEAGTLLFKWVEDTGKTVEETETVRLS
ncbi:thiosulfate oxidation carrier protein SoxY [Pusillimonas sp.]|uniref:thiosulfate oxidation carrier protein SoxY n=1 Tax=Pusillimonas sp. TaxID=3040095 RepID=UPI0037C54CF8